MFKKRKLPRNDRRASVEIVDDAEDIQEYPSGQPKNPAAIIEAADGSDDDFPEMPGQSMKTTTSRQDCRASVEIIDDDDIQVYPSGQPRNPSVILEAADGSDDDLPKMPDQHKKMAKPTASRRDRRAPVETIDDDEFHQYPSGQPKNPTAILEAAEASDDDLPVSGKKKETATEELGEYQKIYYLLVY